jgi:hypothetical protein
MNIQVARVVVVLGALFASAAQAELFIGGGVSNYSYNYTDLDNSSGSKIYGGYYAEGGAFVEIASIELGETESDLISAGLDISGTAAYVGFRSQGDTGWGFFGKIGMYSFDSDLIIAGSTVDQASSSGVSWGFGVTYALSDAVALRGELENFSGVEDFADDESISGGSISLEIRF